MRARYLSLIVLGFVVGAAVVLLADSGGNETRVVAPVASTGGSGAGESHGAGGALTGETSCEKSGPPASAGQAGKHGERGPAAWVSIDRATRDVMTQQLAAAHDVTLAYPTVAAAEAAGWRMTTTYVPCIGAHYINAAYIGGFEVSKPAMLLYDGTTPDSKIVGLSYGALTGKNPPEGFAGPNDAWHQHNLNGGLCIRGGVVVGAESTSEADCKARGGSKVKLDALWMNHVWVADGWPSSWGIFSSEHPDLGGQVSNIDGAPKPSTLEGATEAATG